MFDNLLSWMRNNNAEITWFLIGFLFYAGLVNFGRGNLIEASIDFVLVLVNYILYKK